MPYDPGQHHRRSLRLRGHDYATAGVYFVTICVQGRACLFGTVVDGVMQPNAAGLMVQAAWENLEECFPAVTLDAVVIMPNHIHALLVLSAPAGAVGDQGDDGAQPATTLGAVVGAFKSVTTRAYIRGVETAAWPPFDKRLWQRNYWEHIVRDEPARRRLHAYIAPTRLAGSPMTCTHPPLRIGAARVGATGTRCPRIAWVGDVPGLPWPEPW